MRIVILSSLLPATGLSDRPPDVWLTTRALIERCEAVVIGPVPWAPRLPLKTPWERYGSIPRSEVLDNVTIRHPRYLVVPKTARSLQGRSYARQLEIELATLQGSFRPDAIFVTWAYPDTYAAVRVGAKLGLPVIAKVVGSDVNLLPEVGLRRDIGYALHNADRVVGICQDLCTKAIALGARPDRCVVVKNGLELQQFPMRPRDTCRTELAIPLTADLMVYVGSLKHVKGPDLLMTAFASIATQRPEARLVLIGEGPLRASLQTQAQALGVGERVLFLGRRPHTEVAAWMNAADLLVLPSRSEGLPNVVTEALACGTPVVATRVGGVPEAFAAGVAGVLVEAENSAALGQAIVFALQQPFARDTVRSSLKPRSWSTAAAELLQVIEGAVHERRSGAGAL